MPDRQIKQKKEISHIELSSKGSLLLTWDKDSLASVRLWRTEDGTCIRKTSGRLFLQNCPIIIASAQTRADAMRLSRSFRFPQGIRTEATMQWQWAEYYFHTCSNAYLFAYAPDTYPVSTSTYSDSMSDTMLSEEAERLLNPATSHQP